MKPLVSLLGLSFLLGLAWSPSATTAPTPHPARALPAAGGWTTGIDTTVSWPNLTYAAGEHIIDLTREGVYDPARWMVIIDCNMLTVDAGATVRFRNHSTRAPVVIRASGTITINGTLDLDGENGHDGNEFPMHAEPGPGGFRGGTGLSDPSLALASAGHGVGGGFISLSTIGYAEGGSGSYATIGQPGSGDTGQPGSTYGSPMASPLFGGSGGGGGNPSPNWGGLGGGGGAGGGAILIGSDTSIQLGGTIYARGGQGSGAWSWSYGGGGSGGCIRLASPVITAQGGYLAAFGGARVSGVVGGAGRIRIETGGPVPPNITSNPPASYAPLGDFLPPPGTPAVTLLAWKEPSSSRWMPIPEDPKAMITSGGGADVAFPAEGPHILRIGASNVPIGAPLEVRVTYTRGQAFVLQALVGTPGGGTDQSSWTDVEVTFVPGVTTVQARALLP